MPALDTNALVRRIVRDDPAQLAAAKRLVRRCVAEGQTLLVPPTVVLEPDWVLRTRGKNEALTTLSSLFRA
jgi:predicted nucleic acid-binding protein